MKRLPNMRLKLSGAYRFKGIEVFAPWRARTHVQPLVRPAGGLARSLSAIR